MSSQDTPRRTYRMTARAAAAEATAARILDAGQDLFGELLYDQVSLDAVAAKARVTVRTVMRRFGSKHELFAALAQRMSQQIRADRQSVSSIDPLAAITGVVRNYEHWGRHVLHYLTQEARTDSIATIVAAGREYHHTWVEHTFGPALANLPAHTRRQRLAQLIVATDIYAWKLLRHDLGHTPEQCEALMRHLAGLILRSTHD